MDLTQGIPECVFAYLLGSALIYLFTGKLSSIRMSEDGRPRLVLVDIDTLYEAPSIVPGPAGWSAREGA